MTIVVEKARQENGGIQKSCDGNFSAKIQLSRIVLKINL